MYSSGITIEMVMLGGGMLLGGAIGANGRCCRAFFLSFCALMSVFFVVTLSPVALGIIRGMFNPGGYLVLTGTLLTATAVWLGLHWLGWRLYFFSHEEAAPIVLDKVWGFLFGCAGGYVLTGLLFFMLASSPAGEKLPGVRRDLLMDAGTMAVRHAVSAVDCLAMQDKTVKAIRASELDALLAAAEPPVEKLPQTPR